MSERRGLDQIGPVRAVGRGLSEIDFAKRARLHGPKPLGFRIAISAGRRRKPVITLPKLNLPD